MDDDLGGKKEKQQARSEAEHVERVSCPRSTACSFGTTNSCLIHFPMGGTDLRMQLQVELMRLKLKRSSLMAFHQHWYFCYRSRFVATVESAILLDLMLSDMHAQSFFRL